MESTDPLWWRFNRKLPTFLPQGLSPSKVDAVNNPPIVLWVESIDVGIMDIDCKEGLEKNDSQSDEKGLESGSGDEDGWYTAEEE